LSNLRLKKDGRLVAKRRTRSAGSKAATDRTRPPRRPRKARFSLNPGRAGLIAAAGVLLTGIVLVILSAPGWGRGGERFLLSSFEVRGNRVLTREEVLELCGATMGEPLFDVKVRELETSLAACPRVERAQAVRALPGRVLVTLDERVPEALVAAARDRVFEITGDGTVLPPAARSGAVDLPVITGAVGTVEPGIEELSGELLGALQLLRAARNVSEGLWMDISEVKIAPGSGLVIYTVADGAEIRVGSGALNQDDLRRLWQVLQDLRARGREAASIDLRFRNQVVVKLT
jgi:cell division protein FtsQ